MELESKDTDKILGKKNKKELLEKIKNASDERYVTVWNPEGQIIQQKKQSKIKSGKKAKQSGAKFELKTRDDLQKKGWIVDKWSNNFDLESDKIIPAKRKFNPFSKIMTIGTGFPDYLCFQKMGEYYKVIGVECKVNGLLSKQEKQKCVRFLKSEIFSQILIAKKSNQKKEVEYEDFKEKYSKLFK